MFNTSRKIYFIKKEMEDTLYIIIRNIFRYNFFFKTMFYDIFLYIRRHGFQLSKSKMTWCVVLVKTPTNKNGMQLFISTNFPLGYLQTVTLLLNIISHGLWPWNGSDIWTSSYRMIKKQVNASLNIFSPDTLDTSIQHRQDSSKCIFHTDIQVMKTLFDINSQNGLLICVCWECSWW